MNKPNFRIALCAAAATFLFGGCTDIENLDRDPIQPNRQQLVNVVAEIMEPDDRIHTASRVPVGVRIVNIPPDFDYSLTPLFVLYAEQRYEVEKGTTRLNILPGGRLLAVLNRPIKPDELAKLKCVQAFDIIEAKNVSEILSSIEKGQHTKLVLRDVVLNQKDISVISRMPLLRSLCFLGVRFNGPVKLNFPQLHEIDMEMSEPREALTSVLRHSPDLELITTKGMNLTEADISLLCRLHNLNWLSLSACNLNDPWLRKILAARLPLGYLGTHDTNVSDEGTVGLDKVKSIWFLNLSRCEIGDVTMERAGKLTNISGIDICNTRVGDSGIAALSKLPRLRTLSMINTRITPKCFASLAQMKQLTQIHMKGLDAPIAELRALQKKLPDCELL